MELQPNVVTLLPLDHIRPDPNQPRTEFPETELQALAKDIATRGIDHPILVIPDPLAEGAYLIKDGERRWRAARIAQLAAVPCLQAAALAPEETSVDWLLDQAADNDHAAKLTPLDWARFLKKLTTEHGVALKDVPALLAARGLTLSRPYASNLMRLLDLPEWAQQLVQAGKLTAAHGKPLLVATDSPKAMAHLKDTIEDWDADVNGALTVEELYRQMFWAFDEAHLDIEKNHGDHAPKFDIKTCEGCPNRKVVSAPGFREGLYCLDEKCFEQKQADAAADNEQKITPAQPVQSSRPKPDPQQARQRRREQAARLAETRAVAAIVTQSSGKPDAHDLRLIAGELFGYQQIKTLAERRGWNQKGMNWFNDFARRLKGMDAKELHGALLEAAIGGAGNDAMEAAAKRYGVDLQALEKAALAELTPKKPAKPAAKTKPKKKGTKP